MVKLTLLLPRGDPRLVEQVEGLAVRRAGARGVWWRKRGRRARRALWRLTIAGLLVGLGVAVGRSISG